jgi:hypothetical protein
MNRETKGPLAQLFHNAGADFAGWVFDSTLKVLVAILVTLSILWRAIQIIIEDVLKDRHLPYYIVFAVVLCSIIAVSGTVRAIIRRTCSIKWIVVMGVLCLIATVLTNHHRIFIPPCPSTIFANFLSDPANEELRWFRKFNRLQQEYGLTDTEAYYCSKHVFCSVTEFPTDSRSDVASVLDECPAPDDYRRWRTEWDTLPQKPASPLNESDKFRLSYQLAKAEADAWEKAKADGWTPELEQKRLLAKILPFEFWRNRLENQPTKEEVEEFKIRLNTTSEYKARQRVLEMNYMKLFEVK